MAGTLRLEIVTPEKTAYSEDVEMVTLPGSEGAVRLAMERLLLPELGHLVQQASK